MSRIILTRKLDLKSLKYFCSQLSEFTSFEEPHLFSTAISKSASNITRLVPRKRRKTLFRGKVKLCWINLRGFRKTLVEYNFEANLVQESDLSFTSMTHVTYDLVINRV